jgi:hypothetical protein
MLARANPLRILSPSLSPPPDLTPTHVTHVTPTPAPHHTLTLTHSGSGMRGRRGGELEALETSATQAWGLE